jgi:hypothetical protein
MRSTPFALGACELARLPTVVKKIAEGISASKKDVRDAILSDLPVTMSELECLRGRRAVTGPSVLSNALQIAREVVSYLSPFQR